jgi:hypothetical protein
MQRKSLKIQKDRQTEYTDRTTDCIVVVSGSGLENWFYGFDALPFLLCAPTLCEKLSKSEQRPNYLKPCIRFDLKNVSLMK